MDKPVSECQHSRYTVDRAEQTGRCIDCGAEGRMRFVVGNPVAAERERCAAADEIEHLAAAKDQTLHRQWRTGPGPTSTAQRW
jgi:hypothetical protein